MNTLQMKYFLTAATCLNFTQAADLLYITQPALSRQMASIENELGVSLFVRTNRDVKLTSAGKSLFEDIKRIYDDYQKSAQRAKNVESGLSGKLSIGVLDGTYLSDILPQAMELFTDMFPYVEMTLDNYSFNSLATLLYEGKLDIAITLFFDIQNRHNIAFRVIEKSYDHIAVHRSNPLSAREEILLSDIGDNTFIIISIADSEKSASLILDGCRKLGFSPNVKYSPKLQTSMLWVQSGLGVVMLDSRNILRTDQNVKFLKVNQVSDPSLTAAWHSGNNNPLLSMFVELLYCAANSNINSL